MRILVVAILLALSMGCAEQKPLRPDGPCAYWDYSGPIPQYVIDDNCGGPVRFWNDLTYPDPRGPLDRYGEPMTMTRAYIEERCKKDPVWCANE